MPTATVTSKDQVTHSVRELAGFLHRPGRESVTPEEMGESLAQLLADDDERIRRRLRLAQ